MRNQLTQAVLTGNVQLATEGVQPAEAYAGRATLHFGANQILQSVRAEEDVRLEQQKQELRRQDRQSIEMTAPVMDFMVKNGRVLEPPRLRGRRRSSSRKPGSKQKTVVTADRFTATFADNNRLARCSTESRTPRLLAASLGSPTGSRPARSWMSCSSRRVGSRPSRNRAD